MAKLGWHGPSGKHSRENFNTFLKAKTGVDPNQSGIYYFSHKGRQQKLSCDAEKCQYVGKAKNLGNRMYEHLHGHEVHFDDCLRWDNPSNYADQWTLEFWPVREDKLSHEENEMIRKKKSHEPKGHNEIY